MKVQSPSIRGGVSEEYCEFCGVFMWEVQGFMSPLNERLHSSEPIAERVKRHDKLLQDAHAAIGQGEVESAYLLADRAYTSWRTVAALLLLTELRSRRLGEPGFSAAVYHTMLRAMDTEANESHG